MSDLTILINEKIERVKEELHKVSEDLEVVRRNDSDEEISIKSELLDRKLMLEGELNGLMKTLGQISIDNGKKKNIVSVGHKVVIEINGKKKDVTLVPEGGVNPSAGIFSVESPIGQALLGKKKGEKVLLEGPTGSRELKIVKIN